ncbi:MAG: excinuclease ABC subunit UvrA, partial [Pirellulaceae bacterium]
MPVSDILIKGAREHNLRSVDVTLPRNKLICLTGVSGSGKSSLAFDTVYAEGQRRYVESLSTFARQFLGQMPKPEVDYIGGLSPSISISQKSTGTNPRSTVGTVTEIYDYLRVLFARVGQGHCPRCGREIAAQTREQIIARILQMPADTRFSVLAPIIRRQKGEYRDLFVDLLKQGFVRARVDGQAVSLSDNLKLDRQMRHDIEVVIDRLQARPQLRSRLAEAVDLALKLGKGTLILETADSDAAPVVNPEQAGDENYGARPTRRGAARDGDIVFSVDYACADCGISFEPPSPQLFSFNSPQGMCLQCDGLGELYSFDPDLLIPQTELSFQDGCIELVGPWKELGRWRRHIYQGVADTIERLRNWPQGTLLETPWRELTAEQRDVWLSGTGDQHITFTWRAGASPIKYGGKWGGVIPDLLGRYRASKSVPQRRQLEKYMRTVSCQRCHGERLNDQARFVRITTTHGRFGPDAARSLPQVCQLSIAEAVDFFSALQLDATRTVIATEVLKEIRARLGFLMNVGLDYLTLDRTAPTLSGGETQRIRLAGQIGSGLVGVLYILDEPSIGLHPRDNNRLLATLQRLRDMGNTVVVVEHDEDTMRAADHLIDFGPGPGVRGGEVVASGPAAAIMTEPRSLTGRYLSGTESIAVPPQRRPIGDKRLRVLGARHNNLQGIDVEIPLGAFVCVTGVSGSGKSSLVNDILVQSLLRDLNGGEGVPGHYDRLVGLEHLDKMIAIDQSPIGRTPRSNPGTYIKVFDDIRQLFATLPAAKMRGYEPGRFSFNVAGGRCEACEGNGSNRL